MPHHKSCIKRIGTSEKSRISNRQVKSRIHHTIKNLRNAKDKETTDSELKKSFSILDKAVKAGVIHKNKAANQKSKLSTTVNKTAS